MSHFDRLSELLYTSPSGKEFRPLWDDLERSGGKKAAVHELVGLNVASVQDLGNSAKKYPLSLYFTGENYDLTADGFFKALEEKGRSVLSHPRWGKLDVLPLTWSQSEDLVSGVGAAKFTVEFIAAPDLSLSAVTDTAAAMQSAADTAAESIPAPENYTNAADKARGKSSALKGVKKITTGIKALTSAADTARQDMENAARAITNGIDDLMESPVALVQAMTSLARTPARIQQNIKAKITGYAGLMKDGVNDLLNTPADLVTASLQICFLIAYAISGVDATTAGTLTSRSEAMSARDALDYAIAEVLGAIDSMQAQGYAPDPQILAYLADLRARASAYLLNESYGLPSELSVVLDAATLPCELAYRLTGDADKSGEIAELNGWGGDKLLVIPAGTEVRYYA